MKKQAKCDFRCGRDAVIPFRNVNLCGECLEAYWLGDGPAPRLRFEDVITIEEPLEGEDL